MPERDKREDGHSFTDNKSNNRRGGHGNDRRQQDRRSQYIERVVTTSRVSKVVKDGRRFSFTVLVIISDGRGIVGAGYGKAREVPVAIQKGAKEACKNFFRVPMTAGTITRLVQGEIAAGIALLRPAAPDTGLIAGGAIHPVLEYAGVQDVLSKSLDTNNSINVIHTTVDALKQLIHPEGVAARRGKSLEEVTPVRMLRVRTGQGA